MHPLHLAIPAATAAPVADAAITAAIELFFSTKKGAPTTPVTVEAHDGIVELTGLADSLLARQRAEDIALAVRGVRGVINELLVAPSAIADPQLRVEVAQALAADPATAGYNVHATVAQNVVTLSGLVQSWAEKQLVLRAVQGVRGVRAIADAALLVRGGELLNSDEEITTQIRELLDWDVRVTSRLVEVRTTDRVVHLAGTVGTAAEKARIEALAWQAGAVRVDARDLFVAAWVLPREMRRNPQAEYSDEAVAQAVRDTLHLDPRVQNQEELLVQVHDRTVTLAGMVSNLRARHAAEQDARHVVGATLVHNLLKVRTERFAPDADIRRAVAGALLRNPYLGACDFSVNVLNGRTYLYGRVENYFEQEQAIDVAAGIAGVVEVENRLTIASHLAPAGPAPTSDHDLADAIRTRYHWSAALHDQDVEVRVTNARATLTGTVDTALDRRQAAREAYEAGARDVNNHLLVTAAAEPAIHH